MEVRSVVLAFLHGTVGHSGSKRRRFAASQMNNQECQWTCNRYNKQPTEQKLV